MNGEAERWLKQAIYDMETAEDLFHISRWAACVMHAQQSAEKALKALILAQTNAIPPRWHDIRSLAEASGLLDKVPVDALKLSDYYISARYPDASLAVPHESITEEAAATGLAAAHYVLALVEKELQGIP